MRIYSVLYRIVCKCVDLCQFGGIVPPSPLPNASGAAKSTDLLPPPPLPPSSIESERTIDSDDGDCLTPTNRLYVCGDVVPQPGIGPGSFFPTRLCFLSSSYPPTPSHSTCLTPPRIPHILFPSSNSISTLSPLYLRR